MRHMIFALLFALTSTPIVAQSLPKELPNAKVVRHVEVQVKNPGGIFLRTQATSGKTFKFDEKCSIEEDAVLIAIAEKNGKVLVKYSTTKRSTFLSECPNDTLTFISVDEYKALWSLRREGHTIAQELEMDEVSRLLMSVSKK